MDTSGRNEAPPEEWLGLALVIGWSRKEPIKVVLAPDQDNPRAEMGNPDVRE